VEFRIYAKAGSGSGSFFAIDNVTLNGSVTPEPATIGLFGLGITAIIRRRRK